MATIPRKAYRAVPVEQGFQGPAVRVTRGEREQKLTTAKRYRDM